MLLKTLINTVTTLLTNPTAPNPPANTPATAPNPPENAASAAASNVPEQDNGGVNFDFSEKALEAVGNNAAQTAQVPEETTAPAAAPPPAVETATAAPATAPAEAGPANAGSARPSTATVAVEDRPATATSLLEQAAEADPSEEARARAHAEQQLETSRLRNLAISGYEDSRKLFNLIATDTKTAETKAEAAPLRQALTAA